MEQTIWCEKTQCLIKTNNTSKTYTSTDYDDTKDRILKIFNVIYLIPLYWIIPWSYGQLGLDFKWSYVMYPILALGGLIHIIKRYANKYFNRNPYG